MASLLMHAFLTPVPALLGLVAMLPAMDLSEGEDLVEVELTALPVGAVAEKPEDAAQDEAEPAASDPEDPPEPSEPEPEQPASEPTPVEDAEPEVSDPVEDAPPGETQEFGDPVALAGSAGAIADSNANVRMFLFNDVVREHPLGEKVGELLQRTPQWRDFFGPSRIDPIADIDRVLIAGPQLRNSSQVVAVVKHNMGRDRIEEAFQNLVARQGQWIEREQLIARARADRADRVFAAPNESVVVVAPLALEQQVRSLGAETRFPPSAGDVAVTAYIITPANVAKGTGIQLPKTVKWARIDLRPLSSGGAILKLLAEDEDEQHAKRNAMLFEQLLKAATTVDPSKLQGGLGAMASMLGFKKQEYVKSIEFRSDGKEIHGTIEVTENQLLLAADLLASYLPPLDEKSARPKSGGKEKRTTKSGASAGTDGDDTSSTPQTDRPSPIQPPRTDPDAPTEDRKPVDSQQTPASPEEAAGPETAGPPP